MPKRKHKNTEPAGELYSRALILAKGETLEALFTRSGLPLSWLRKFRAGEIANPSVNRVETILKSFGKF
jgi:transcriptional regulator with XRE-family HTH domain